MGKASQPVTDTAVSMDLTLGDGELEGEDDDNLLFTLAHQGNGVYLARTLLG